MHSVHQRKRIYVFGMEFITTYLIRYVQYTHRCQTVHFVQILIGQSMANRKKKTKQNETFQVVTLFVIL